MECRRYSLQHTTTHSNTLHPMECRRYSLQHTTTHSNTLHPMECRRYSPQPLHNRASLLTVATSWYFNLDDNKLILSQIETFFPTTVCINLWPPHDDYWIFGLQKNICTYTYVCMHASTHFKHTALPNLARNVRCLDLQVSFRKRDSNGSSAKSDIYR